MKILKTIAFALLALFTLFTSFGKDPVDYVNPFIGTSNSRWTVFPGTNMPNGMVKLSPDNQGNVWNGGYEYTIANTHGFSFLHSLGLGSFSIMPHVGKLNEFADFSKLQPGLPDNSFGHMWSSGYHSRFRKEDEVAKIGYYKTFLLDYGIKAELTSTERTGYLRFTYPQSDKAHILIDFNAPKEEYTKLELAEATIISKNEIEGHLKMYNQYALEHDLYFVIQTDKEIKRTDAWESKEYEGADKNYGTEWRRKTSLIENMKTIAVKDLGGLVLNFNTSENEVVQLRSALSFVSIAQARKNLEIESAPFGWDFDKVVENQRFTWNKLLSTIMVEGDEVKKEQFYTSLYRTFSGKAIISDANGKFIDLCEKVQTLPADVKYIINSDAFWGTQFNLSPLLTLAYPKIASEWIKSLLQMGKIGGWIPEAPILGEYSPIMGAQHQISLFVNAAGKGLKDIDYASAYSIFKHDLTTQGINHTCGGFAGNRQMEAYIKFGYVPDEQGAVSNTTEYAYDDGCMAAFAKLLNKKDDYIYFKKRSENYKNVFDVETKFIRRKKENGAWIAPLDTFVFGTEGSWNGPGYMEGNAWIYTFFAPHQVPELIKLMGEEVFLSRLENGIEKHLFDLANQPSLHVPWLFNYTSKPWLTQKTTRKLMTELYDNSPYFGWYGEEDEGQMCANFVLGSIGLFQVDGGCGEINQYTISSPLFDKVTIKLDNGYFKGNQIEIIAYNNTQENVYIQSLTWNGQKLEKPFISHQELAKGGKLVFEMGAKPNLNLFK